MPYQIHDVVISLLIVVNNGIQINWKIGRFIREPVGLGECRCWSTFNRTRDCRSNFNRIFASSLRHSSGESRQSRYSHAPLTFALACEVLAVDVLVIDVLASKSTVHDSSGSQPFDVQVPVDFKVTVLTTR